MYCIHFRLYNFKKYNNVNNIIDYIKVYHVTWSMYNIIIYNIVYIKLMS